MQLLLTTAQNNTMAKVRSVFHFLQKKLSQQCHVSGLSLQSPLSPSSHVIHDSSVPTQYETTSSACEEAPLQISDVPGPRSLPGIGAIWQYLPGGRFYGLDLNDAIRRLRGLYGDVVREEIVPGLTVLRLFNPHHFADAYKAEGDSPHRVLFGLLTRYNEVNNEGVQGLLTSQGKQWKLLRREVQQALLPPKTVKSYCEQQVNISNDFVDHITRLTAEKAVLEDILPEVYKFATEAVGTVCFDRRIGLLRWDNAEGKSFIHAVHECLTLTQKELKLLPLYRYFPTPVFARFSAAQGIVRSTARRFLDMAMSPCKGGRTGKLINHLLFSSHLTYREIFTFLAEFFSAGVDTTGHYLAFTLCALGQNPDVQDKLYNEIKHIADDDFISGALDSAQYMRAFLKESLRMYPVAPGLGRTLQTDAVIAGFHVPAGTNVVLHYDMAGKDSRFVSSPENFSPDRWLRDNREKISPFVTLPFGFGPRSCPGRRLAVQEVGIVIAKLLQKFHITYNGDELPISMQILNTPAESLSFTFQKRNLQ